MTTKRTLLPGIAGLIVTGFTAFAGPESWKAPVRNASQKSCCAPGKACCEQKLACCDTVATAAAPGKTCCNTAQKGKSCCAR